MNAEETITFLEGSWTVRREVSDQRSGDASSFVGTATFARIEGLGESALSLEETGDVRLGDYHGKAHRRLEYVAASDSTMRIRFLDGRHYIDLDLTGSESRDVHLCNADRYEITTIVTSSDTIEERWRVRGPEKDYVAVTTLERLSEGV
jgi:hypothetical protein